MKTETAFEIAESFINGNISWVKARTKSKQSFLAVLKSMKEVCPDSVDSFIRICGN